MRGMGYVSVALLRQALQNVGRGGPIVNPFPQADYDWLTYPSTESPPHYWERIRGSSVYGPGATGNYAWMNDPGQWVVSPLTTETLNLNREIIRHAKRFEDINWNDPRIRYPEGLMPTPASEPVPELPQPVAPAAATPAPATPAGPTAPDFGTPSAPAYGGDGSVIQQPIYYSSEPIPGDPTSGTPAPQVKQAGLFGGAIPPWALTLVGIALAMPIILGKTPGGGGRRRRR